MFKNRRRANRPSDRRVRDVRVEGSADRRIGASDRRTALRYLGLSVFCLGVAAPASAQIYSWKDANGNLVVSNRRQGGTFEVKSYAVPTAAKVRATRYVAADRAQAYDEIITQHCRTHGVRTDLVKAVMQVESAFNPRALSPKGAMGLMQLMPSTARQYGVQDPFDPAQNVRGGVAYLRHLLDRYGNNEQLALAAYNAGPGAVDKYGQSVPPYRETRNYVAQISSMTSRPIALRTASIYKVTETIDGRAITRYTDKKPASGPVELVAR
jgi:soluble lytic murein transglycosylase-like protein